MTDIKAMLEIYHKKVRRLEDAIFCIEDSGEIMLKDVVQILQDRLNKAREKYQEYWEISEEDRSQRKETIPSKIRWAVWERDNFTCQHCGKRQGLSIDHIRPESKGGTLELSNLQTLCKRCNSRKGAR